MYVLYVCTYKCIILERIGQMSQGQLFTVHTCMYVYRERLKWVCMYVLCMYVYGGKVGREAAFQEHKHRNIDHIQ